MFEINYVKYYLAQVKGRKIAQFCKEYYVIELKCTMDFRDDQICASDVKGLISPVIKR